MIEFHGKTLETFKAGLHTHSTVSDGQFPPQEVIRRYADHGYRALALTDHRKTHPVGCYDSCGMTLIPGIEIHPQGPRGIPWHLLSLGVPEEFPAEYASGQEAVDAVNAAGGIVFEAHPYWCGFTAAELMTLKGICGIEVYNTSTRYIGKAYNMQIWDELLDAGCRCSALAVDDMHRSCDLFRDGPSSAPKTRSRIHCLTRCEPVRSTPRRGRNYTASAAKAASSKLHSPPASKRS